MAGSLSRKQDKKKTLGELRTIGATRKSPFLAQESWAMKIRRRTKYCEYMEDKKRCTSTPTHGAYTDGRFTGFVCERHGKLFAGMFARTRIEPLPSAGRGDNSETLAGYLQH